MPLLVFHLIIETTVWGLQTDTQQARENCRGSADSRVRPTSTGEHDSCGTHTFYTASTSRVEPYGKVANMEQQAGVVDAMSQTTNRRKMSRLELLSKS